MTHYQNKADINLLSLISENEKILWQGRPNKKCFILESIFNPLLPFAILWGGIDSIFIYLSTNIPKNSGYIDNTIGITFILFFFAIHLMPVWIYLFGVLFSFLRYKNKSFAITDQGVYVSGGILTKNYKRKSFAEMSTINLHNGIIDQILGVGDVIITGSSDIYNTNTSLHRGTIICDISDYKEVYKLIKNLQKDIYADTHFPNDLRPKENHGYQTKYVSDN